MRATLDDVAKAAGVSAATVSYVINGSKPISASTRAKVREAIAELNYRPSPSARALRTGQHQMLGLLLPDLANPFFPALSQAVAETARELGYGLMLSESGSDSASEDQALSAIQERVDGVVWVPETREPATRPYRPTVIIDRAGPDLMEFDSVSSDHRLGGRLLAWKIRELGHRRIGVLRDPPIPSAVDFAARPSVRSWVILNQNGWSKCLMRAIYPRRRSRSYEVQRLR